MLDFLAAHRAPERQPNLLLAAVRFMFGTQPDYERFRSVVLTHRGDVSAVLRTRRTQTNEPGRCAALLPSLSRLPEPLALLEVGASAGLCLLVDRYGYDYDGSRIGSGEVVLPCTVHGDVPLPDRLPEIAWRAGIDLAPVDVGDPVAVRWLEALVWPEETDRLDRLRAAVRIARRDPPRVVAGDLLDRLGEIASQAPRDATLVVFHTAVLAYLPVEGRRRFADAMAALGAEWISCEGPGVLDLHRSSAQPVAPSHFVLARGGRDPVAYCDPHGRWLQWL
jgi:hypothetical protein